MEEEGTVHVLCVCTGNICRSPMAEGLVRHLGAQLGLAVEVKSAGTLKLPPQPAERRAVAVMREIGLDISGHRSQEINEELMAWADRIVVMEPSHAAQLAERFPELLGQKVVQLGPLVGEMLIEDPVSTWFKFSFRRTRDQLREGLLRLLRGLDRV